jgi:hypothetical protein
MSQIATEAGVRTPATEIIGPIQKRIEQAKRDRARQEPVWHSNRAYAAGKYWLRWSRADRRLKLDPRDVQHGLERTTVDILTQKLWTAIGQLAGVEERRQLLFRREDIPSEDFTKAANDALAYGWDNEWRAPEILASIKRKLVVDGTAAVQCYFDPTVGPELGEMPVGDDQQPIADGQKAREYVANKAEQGQTASYRRVNQGRICWKPRSVFQIIVPPGIENEEDFPWEAIVEAVEIDKLIQRYGDKARGLSEEPLAMLDQIGLKDSIESGFGADPEGDPGVPGKLDKHVALVTYYERPSTKYAKGRVVTYAGNRLLEQVNELPYKRPNGDYHSGIVYFHYWRTEGRFWGRALIEPGKGIQRTYNKRCQQEQLTIDRGQPFILADGTQEIKQTETPLEVVNFEANSGMQPPTAVRGVDVSESLWRSKENLIDDLDRAMGINAVSTGEEATRQTTYAELALRAEKDQVKIDPLREDFQMGVAVLTELSLWDVRRYWPRDKLIAVSGEEDYAEAVNFEAAKLPEFFMTQLAEGVKPRTQAAEIQLVADLWAADQANVAATGGQQPPQLDLEWLAASNKAGKALPFPDSDKDVHGDKARWENSTMLETGEVPEPMYYDPIQIHLPAHRQAQVEAEMADNLDLVDTIEQHLQLHFKVADEQATAQAQGQAEITSQSLEAQGNAEQLAQAQQGQQQSQQSAQEHGQNLQLEAMKQAGQSQQSQTRGTP